MAPSNALGRVAVHQPQSLWISPEDPHANAKANTIIAQQLYNKILDKAGVSRLN